MSQRHRGHRNTLRATRRWRLLLLFAFISPCFATSQHEVFTNGVSFSRIILTSISGFHAETAALDNPLAAKEFIAQMRQQDASLPPLDGQHPDTYVLIHLLRWADSATPDKPKVQADHWYLYRDIAPKNWSQEDFTTGKRIQGITKMYVIYVHLQGQKIGPDGKTISEFIPTYTPDYDFTITKKTPANVAHLYALLQSYAGGAASGSNAKPNERVQADAIWGGGILNIQYRPSDILIKTTFRIVPSDPDQKLADDISYDNEGPYYWDVGFAVPVRKISEIKLDATSGTATPAQVNSQSVFAVVDGYLRPVDVKGSAFDALPHPIAGTAFAKRPLSKILIGGAWGPKASELYMGVMLVKQPELSSNSSCSHPSGTSLTGRSHYCAQFTIGINLSVSAIASKLGAPK